jgi:hypothetical protein
MNAKINRRLLAQKAFEALIEVVLAQIPVVGLGASLTYTAFAIYKEVEGEAQVEAELKLWRLLDDDQKRAIVEAVLRSPRGWELTKNLNDDQLHHLRNDLIQLPSEFERLLDVAIASEDSERNERNRARAEQARFNYRMGLENKNWPQVYKAVRVLRRMGYENPELKRAEVEAYERGKLHMRVYAVGISIGIIGLLIIADWAFTLASEGGPTPLLLLPYVVIEFFLIRLAARSTTTGTARRYAYAAVWACPIFTLAVVIVIWATSVSLSLQ